MLQYCRCKTSHKLSFKAVAYKYMSIREWRRCVRSVIKFKTKKIKKSCGPSWPENTTFLKMFDIIQLCCSYIIIRCEFRGTSDFEILGVESKIFCPFIQNQSFHIVSKKCCPKNYKEAFWGSVPATNWLLAPIKSRKTIQVTHDEIKICPFLAKMLPAIIRGSILGFWDCYRSISHPILITINHPSGPLFELETCPFKAKILLVIPKWSILDICESHQSISRSRKTIQVVHYIKICSFHNYYQSICREILTMYKC